MSLGNFPQDPYEPLKKNQPQKSPSIDEPSPSQKDIDDENIGLDEGVLNLKK